MSVDPFTTRRPADPESARTPRFTRRDVVQLVTFAVSVVAFFALVLPRRELPVFVALAAVFLLLVPLVHRGLWQVFTRLGKRR